MNATLTTAAVVGLMASAGEAASTWEVDVSHSELGFKVRHLMVSYTRGKFEAFSGRLELDEKDLSRSKVQVTIDAKSIETSSKDRDAHLRSADFFDVERFPSLSFESTRVEQVDGRLKITGNLSIRGVTRKVTLDADPLSAPVKDPWGGTRIGTRATTRISRKDFGLTWNKALEAGGVAVGDEVEMNLEIELIKKP